MRPMFGFFSTTIAVLGLCVGFAAAQDCNCNSHQSPAPIVHSSGSPDCGCANGCDTAGCDGWGTACDNACDSCGNGCKKPGLLSKLKSKLGSRNGGCDGCNSGERCEWYRPYTEKSQADLFYNYYQPNNNGSTAAAFPAPYPTPSLVGHTYNTYQPFYPTEMLYTHHRTYHQHYNNGMGLNRTKVRWSYNPLGDMVRKMHKMTVYR